MRLFFGPWWDQCPPNLHGCDWDEFSYISVFFVIVRECAHSSKWLIISMGHSLLWPTLLYHSGRFPFKPHVLEFETSKSDQGAGRSSKSHFFLAATWVFECLGHSQPNIGTQPWKDCGPTEAPTDLSLHKGIPLTPHQEVALWLSLLLLITPVPFLSERLILAGASSVNTGATRDTNKGSVSFRLELHMQLQHVTLPH